MRVITGIARGRRLKALKGMETRPTLDRTKESLFNIIGPRVIEAKFLDLYAGTGAIGIEAISRGAHEVVFVEINPRAVKIINENLDLTGLSEKAQVICQDSEKAISQLSNRNMRFDIVFLDPPYLKDLIDKSLRSIDAHGLLSISGLIITESSKADHLPEEVGHLRRFRDEKYGDTILSFYQNI